MTPRSIAKSWVMVGMIFGLACSAHARLGETVAQIEARYGPPDPPRGVPPSRVPPIENSSRDYHHDGIKIGVRFYNGISGKESYYRATGESHQLSEKDIETLLNANSNGKPWTHLRSPSGNNDWTCENGYTAAFSGQDVLVIKDPAKIQAAQEAKEKNAKPPAGF